MSEKFRELLDAYWYAAYDQGVCQGNYDDVKRSAENAERAVLEFVDGLNRELAEARRERDEAIARANQVGEHTAKLMTAVGGAYVDALKEKP